MHVNHLEVLVESQREFMLYGFSVPNESFILFIAENADELVPRINFFGQHEYIAGPYGNFKRSGISLLHPIHSDRNSKS